MWPKRRYRAVGCRSRIGTATMMCSMSSKRRFGPRLQCRRRCHNLPRRRCSPVFLRPARPRPPGQVLVKVRSAFGGTHPVNQFRSGSGRPAICAVPSSLRPFSADPHSHSRGPADRNRRACAERDSRISFCQLLWLRYVDEQFARVEDLCRNGMATALDFRRTANANSVIGSEFARC